MNRTEFLNRVRDAARAGRAHEVHVPEIPPDVGYVGGGTDLAARFAQEVQSVGGQAHVATDLRQASEWLESFLNRVAPKSVLCWDHQVLRELQLPQIMARLNIQWLGYAGLAPETGDSDKNAQNAIALRSLSAADQRTKMLSADLGLSTVAFAVAETGTVALDCGPGRERSISLLPPIYLTIVLESQVLPDLFDLFARLQADGLENLPSCYSLITGPSKTGDIELQLTTGVHGPREWYVLVVRGS